MLNLQQRLFQTTKQDQISIQVVVITIYILQKQISPTTENWSSIAPAAKKTARKNPSVGRLRRVQVNTQHLEMNKKNLNGACGSPKSSF